MKDIKISVNKKAGFPENGETLEVMTLEEAFDYQSQLSFGKEKFEYGGIYSFKNGIKLEKGKDDSVYENDGILFIDVDHIYDSFADDVFSNFEALFENIHGIIGVCYSASHNLHFFGYSDKHLTPELYKEEAIKAAKIVSWVLWNRYAPGKIFEEFARSIYDWKKNCGKPFQLDFVFDLHNSNPYQSFFFCPGNSKLIDSGAIGENEYIEKIIEEVDLSTPKKIQHRDHRCKKDANIPVVAPSDKLCIDRNFVVEGLSGNDLRMGICSWLVKYFGEEKAKEYIKEKFSNYREFSINSKTPNYDYRRIKSWIFNNLDIFNQLKETKPTINSDDRINLYDYLFTDELKSLIDKNIAVEENQYLSRYLSPDLFKEEGKKLIISAQCGIGKTHFIREYKGWCGINRPEENIYILCPYGSVQRQYWKDGVINYNIFDLTNKSEHKIELKPGDTVFIDEIHLALVDSEYRLEETAEYEKLINRNDINICFFTATPTIGLVKNLKEKGFKYINLDKKVARRIGLISVDFLERRYLDSMFNGIKLIIQALKSKYTGIVICCNSVRSDKAYSLGINSDKIITANNYRTARLEDWETLENDNSMRKSIRNFVGGTSEWEGVFWCTRFSYAGIDNQIENQNLLFITLNSEINILDLIQLTNRCRKANVDVINIIDDDYKLKKTYNISGVFNDAFYKQEVFNCENPICNIGKSVVLDDSEDEFHNIIRLNNIGIIDRCKIKNNNDGTFTAPDDSIIKVSTEDLYKLWEENPELQESIMFNKNFSIFKDTMKNRKIFLGNPEEDKLYSKVLMKGDKISEDIECVRTYIYNEGNFNSRISKISGDNYGVYDWSAIDLEKSMNKNFDELKDNFLNDKRFFIHRKLRDSINSQENYAIIVRSIIKNIYSVKKEMTRGEEILNNIGWNKKKRFKEFEEDENNNFKKLKIHLTKEYDQTECTDYISGNVDGYFNDQTIVIEDGIEKIANEHNERKVGGSNKKIFSLISDSSIIFNNLDDCFKYAINNNLFSGSFETFRKKGYKKIFNRDR